MTIEFNCPRCGALIAFDSQHAGKRAKCLGCGQKLIIPPESFQKPEKVEPEPEPKGDPIPGFYRAVFRDSWKVLVRQENVTTLVFIVAVVCFKFFLAQACCCNYVSAFVIWGWLFAFYGNLIYRVAMDDDLLPEIDLGTSVTWLWYILRPFLVFLYTLFLVELPFIIAVGLSGDREILKNLLSDFSAVPLYVRALFGLGLFLFPAAILTTVAGRDLTLLRPDHLLAPVFRAFIPYMVAVSLLAGVCFVEWHTTQFTGADLITTTKHLALNLAVQVVAIIAMRSVGLLYRHYFCYFKW